MNVFKHWKKCISRYIDRGRIDNCLWSIDRKYTLLIKPVENTDGFLNDCPPWPWTYCSHKIRKVVIKNGVTAGRYISYMFCGMENCSIFDIAGMDISRVWSIGDLFYNCRSLTDISSLTKWNVSNVKDIRQMFYGCCNLKDLSPLTEWDVRNVECMDETFKNCRSITDISPLSKWNVISAMNVKEMFGNCSALSDASPIRSWTTAYPILTDDMFNGASVKENPLGDTVPMACPREGKFIGWKKCRNGNIVKLLIPEDAKRSSAFRKKCRCDKAVVLGIWDHEGKEIEQAESYCDPSFVYNKGETVNVPDFDTNRFAECAPGIHFFMERKDAENYEIRSPVRIKNKDTVSEK